MPDASKSYLSWLNTETVVVELRRWSARDATEWEHVEVTKALRRSIDHRQSSFAGVAIQGDEIVWNLPDTLLQLGRPIREPAREIRIGDKIVETTLARFDPTKPDQKRWVVLSVQKLTYGSRWRCVCRLGVAA